MSSMADLVDTTIASVMGESATVDPTSYLLTSVDANDTAFTVADSSQFSRGLIQIEDELIVLTAASRSDGSLTTHLSARGVRGTAAVAHPAGALVTMNPTIPRIRAVRAVEEALRADSGLFAVGTLDLTFTPAIASYDVPDEVRDILSVKWESPYPFGAKWQRIRRWKFDRHNRQLVLSDAPLPGATIRVSYTKEPTVPAMTGNFADSGLPLSCVDVIRFSAAWRISSFLEAHNLLVNRAEADVMARQQPTAGTRIRVAQYFYGMYQQRLAEEVAALANRWPGTVHFER